ncbi:MAG: hypothetical protein HYY06_07805 [Deltaproteobacteria bacterium]|nr:hypothetical protein [Deltaproteobacteria bacterium]
MRRAIPWLLLVAIGCGDDDDSAGVDGGSDGDADADADADADTDADADADGDADAGADGGGPGPERPVCVTGCGSASGVETGVAAGQDLQAAIDAAGPGDTLLLEAGATFTGHFELPVREGSDCVTIRTSTPDEELEPGVRVSPADAAMLARVVTPGDGLPAISTEPGAHHYRLVGLEIAPQSDASQVYSVVALGSSGQRQSSIEDVPHHIVIERSWIHGWPDADFKRGIALDSADTCIAQSWIDDFHSADQDSQAIGGFNGPGPFQILDNRLEAAAENVMFGGAVPSIPDLVPSDIEVRGNHFSKPLAWRAGDPANTGYTPVVKNLFEIKNGRDVVFEGNLLENNWAGADQHGFAIVLTPRGEQGAAPQATAERVWILRNHVRHVGGGVNILGRDGSGPSQQASDITIAENLFEDIRGDYARDVVRVIQFTEVAGLVVDHNTFVYADGSWPLARTYGEATTDFVYTNNVVEEREGLWSDCGANQAALDCLLPGARFEANVLIGGADGDFVSPNLYPATIDDVGFVDWSGGAEDFGGYAISDASPYAGAGTDGTTPGFDPEALEAALGQ